MESSEIILLTAKEPREEEDWCEPESGAEEEEGEDQRLRQLQRQHLSLSVAPVWWKVWLIQSRYNAGRVEARQASRPAGSETAAVDQ